MLLNNKYLKQEHPVTLLILLLCRSELRCEEFWQEWKSECVVTRYVCLAVISQLSEPDRMFVLRADAGCSISGPLKSSREHWHHGPRWRPTAGVCVLRPRLLLLLRLCSPPARHVAAAARRRTGQRRCPSYEITKSSTWWDPLRYTLSHSPSASRSHWRTALYMTLRSPLERGMCWESWVWLYSQKMRSVVGHSYWSLFYPVSKQSAGIQYREQQGIPSVVSCFRPVHTNYKYFEILQSCQPRPSQKGITFK